jgi:hypothetical protein
MFGINRKKGSEEVKYVLKQLRDYGLEIEVNYATLEVFIVDLNDKWPKN